MAHSHQYFPCQSSIFFCWLGWAPAPSGSSPCFSFISFLFTELPAPAFQSFRNLRSVDYSSKPHPNPVECRFQVGIYEFLTKNSLCS